MESLVGRHGATVNDRVSIAAALRGPDLSPIEVARKEIERARAIGIPISMHVATRRAGPGGISALSEKGLLGPDLQFVHVTDASNDEVAMIADAGAQIVVPPIAELSMGTGFPPLRRLADSHSHFGLGVDSVLGSPPDMFSQMRLAAGLLRAGEWTAGEPPAGSGITSVLAAATIGGARACWMAEETGSLTPGKSADLLLFRPSRAVETLAEAYGQVIWMGDPSRLVSVRVAGEEMLTQK
ncbi:amidohydrolase family protein [Paenarthrobacter sp. RAF54_2]|uniref:amidohydrolase family protein n=1 Tax=Paenarthrobacter sp. RAF54_2 TaxID=3233061 RepID=UPI003F9BDCB7